jgi:2-aminoadipate transaminase
MHLPLDRGSDVPLRTQITTALRERIESGELAVGARLLSSRDLATTLGVNRTTVVQSYTDLLDAGLVESGVGRGTFVREPAHARRGAAARGPAKAAGARKNGAGGTFPWSTFLAHRRTLPTPPAAHGNGDARVPLARAVGHPDLFPAERIEESLARVFARQGRELLNYAAPAGYEPLRAALVKRLARSGVAVGRNELVIVNGSQQGLDLVARLLLSDGGVVITSKPSFSGALDVFRWHRAQMVGVPTDADGLEPAALERALATTKPRFVYAIPDRNNPTGVSMTKAGRERLLAAVQAARVPLLEDDWLAELRGDDEPPPVKALDRDDQVLYLGTFSKVLAPGLRLGWLLVPKALFEPLLALKKICDLATNLPAQAVLHDLLESGFLDQHVRDLEKKLERRRAIVDAAIDAHFPEEARPRRPHSGMVCWIELPRRADVPRIVEEARRAGVDIAPGAPFDPLGAPVPAFRLSYATAEERDLEPALKRLGEVLTTTLDGSGGASAPQLV